jgi:hypothetical protein
MLSSYYDESSVDGNGPVAAVGGLLLNKDGYDRLTSDWYKALAKHPKLPINSDGLPYIHMKDFGADGLLSDYLDRRALFSDLATIVNRRKAVSIGATVMTENYRYSAAVFRKVPKFGFHSLCFLMSAIQQAKFVLSKGYEHDVPYMLDGECNAEDELRLAHKFITNKLPEYPCPHPYKAAGIMFEDDKKFPALQAADVIAWTVRREKANHPFPDGFEPLAGILEVNHRRPDFEDEWMTECFGLM